MAGNQKEEVTTAGWRSLLRPKGVSVQPTEQENGTRFLHQRQGISSRHRGVLMKVESRNSIRSWKAPQHKARAAQENKNFGKANGQADTG